MGIIFILVNSIFNRRKQSQISLRNLSFEMNALKRSGYFLCHQV